MVKLREDLIKENLKDPSIYKSLSNRDTQIATGFIRYSAKTVLEETFKKVLIIIRPQNNKKVTTFLHRYIKYDLTADLNWRV